MSKNRTRKNRVVFYLSDEEMTKLEQRMGNVNISNREHFIRKLTLDGYIISVDTTPVAELVRLIKNSISNINQVAKRANECGAVYEEDVLDLLAEQKRLVPFVIEAHKSITDLSKY